ncbi:MAG: hypothetical protein H7X70_02445 [Candidatus Kapabacteria bacterium]|nr:hypothetical protein [Candidatus Kapabacteria bacterium]
MKQFAELCIDLERTSHESVQQHLFGRYTSAVPSSDAETAMALLAGSLSVRVMRPRDLADLLINYTNTTRWLFEQCRGLGGTLVDTAVLLLPKTTSQCQLQLGELIDWLSSLRGVSKESQSAAIIELLNMCSVQERTTLARLLAETLAGERRLP